jgi:hypothetical protein
MAILHALDTLLPAEMAGGTAAHGLLAKSEFLKQNGLIHRY